MGDGGRRPDCGLLIGQARTSLAENAFAKFRALYPGKSPDIEQAMLVNWTLDPYAGTCLPLGWQPGQTAKFWPELIRPYGRIHFTSVATHRFPMSWRPACERRR